MIRGSSAIIQALLGSLFTWSLTAAGASLVFVFNSEQRKLLDGSLGFAGGVMIAASFWSLLDPAISISKETIEGNFNALIPSVIGFLLGAVFVFCVDLFLPQMNSENIQKALLEDSSFISVSTEILSNKADDWVEGGVRRRGQYSHEIMPSISLNNNQSKTSDYAKEKSWRRILLLVIAVTVHNIPEGLAVGVGFGAVGKSKGATFESARNLAFGIGIQNFPEGLAVSLPLRGLGFSVWKCFWWGQMSGLVEPIASLAGAVAVSFFEPLLPYALAFAAGAMVFVVIEDIIPEAHSCGNGKLTTWSFICGFLIMMILDVGLG